jgi:outer membrane protein assembly factor BamB
VGLAPSQLAATNPNWRLDENTQLETSAGVLVSGTGQDPTNDRLIVEGADTPSHYLAVLSNIYTATPTVTKSPAIDGPIEGAIALSLDGTLAYATSRPGTVYAIRVADATIAWQVSLGAAVSWSTPWLDFGFPGGLLVADSGGHVTSLDPATGAQNWKTAIGPSIHSSLVSLNGIVWVGADDGSLYRLDASTGAQLGQGTSLCVNPSACNIADQIWAGIGADIVNNHLFVGVSNRLIQIDIGPSGCTSASTTCAFQPFNISNGSYLASAAHFYGGPAFDQASGYIYFGFNNRLWRAAYSSGLTGSMQIANTADPNGLLRGVNSDAGFPASTPTVVGSSLFLGDGGGFFHRFDLGTFSESAVKSFTNPSASPGSGSIDSAALSDVVGGNLYFSVRNSTSPQGSWISLPQNFTSDSVVTAGPAVSLRVTATSTVAAGAPFSVTITALDSVGNTATSYTGTIHFTSSDATAGLPANYTFTGADAGVHTFSNAATLNSGGNQTVTATDTVTASITGSATVFVTAGGAAHFLVYSTFGLTTTGAGSPMSVSVQALDANNNAVSGYTGTVHFTSSDSQATLPADYTFTVADGGIHHFYSQVTLRTPGTQSVTATDTSNISTTGTFSIQVAAGSLRHLGVTAPSSTAAGAPFSVTVAAQDASGNTIAGYLGTVHFTSSDAQSTLPADYTFTAADNGSHTFAGVSLTNDGTQTITVTDAANSVSGSATIDVNASAATHLLVYSTFGLTNTPVGVPISISILALDAHDNIVQSYTGTVSWSSTDGAATVPATYTFTTGSGGDNGIHHFYSQTIYRTTGTQTVTATDQNGLTGSFSIMVTP